MIPRPSQSLPLIPSTTENQSNNKHTQSSVMDGLYQNTLTSVARFSATNPTALTNLLTHHYHVFPTQRQASPYGPSFQEISNYPSSKLSLRSIKRTPNPPTGNRLRHRGSINLLLLPSSAGGSSLTPQPGETWPHPFLLRAHLVRCPLHSRSSPIDCREEASP